MLGAVAHLFTQDAPLLMGESKGVCLLAVHHFVRFVSTRAQEVAGHPYTVSVSRADPLLAAVVVSDRFGSEPAMADSELFAYESAVPGNRRCTTSRQHSLPRNLALRPG